MYQDFVFECIRKPLYLISYNSDMNSFVCNGRLRNCKIHVSGVGHKIVIEKGVVLNSVLIDISGKGHTLIIRKGVQFRQGGRFRIEDSNNVVELLDSSDFSDVFFSIADNNNRIIVGKDCLFSAGIIIRASDGHSVLDEKGNRCNRGANIEIGNRVWVGYGVTVLKGCTIGDDSIIGAESLLPGKEEYPAMSVIAGMPAKVIKQGCHWCKRRL